MNRAAKIRALRADLEYIIEQAPLSGAVDSGGHPYHPQRFTTAVRNRRFDDDGLVGYIANLIAKGDGEGFNKLAAADATHLTVEALVTDESKPYHDLHEFIGVRHVARRRLQS